MCQILRYKQFRPRTTLTPRRAHRVTNCWCIYGLDARRIVVRFAEEQENFILYKTSRLAMGPTHSPTQWVPPSLPTGGKVAGGKKLTNHPHIMPRSIISDAVPPVSCMLSWRAVYLETNECTAVVCVIQVLLTACCEKLLMIDRGTVRNVWSFIPKQI